MSMKKKNKELLKRIYDEEYAKAVVKEQKAALNREMTSIRKLAQKRAYAKYHKREFRAKKRKQLARSVKGAGKRYKRIAGNFQKSSDRLIDDILGR